MHVIDSHAHFAPELLDLDPMLAKLDAAGVQKVALIPEMNGHLPKTPEALLSVVRFLMRRKRMHPLAELIHRSTLTSDGNLRLAGDIIPIYPFPDNAPVAAALQAHPERLMGWIFLNPGKDPNVLDTLEKWRQIKGYVGVKLHPHWHDFHLRTAFPLFERCQELGLPVLIHLGFGKRGAFRDLASAFPKLRIISAHAGFPFYDDMWRLAGAYPNLYVDLSSPYITEELARDCVKVMGPERCLFGTDAPYGFPDEDETYDYTEIRCWVERMPVPLSKREAMLGQTFAELVGL